MFHEASNHPVRSPPISSMSFLSITLTGEYVSLYLGNHRIVHNILVEEIILSFLVIVYIHVYLHKIHRIGNIHLHGIEESTVRLVHLEDIAPKVSRSVPYIQLLKTLQL